MMTCLIRNTLTVGFLSAGITAIYCTRLPWRKGVPTIFAYCVFTLFKTFSPLYIHSTDIIKPTLIAKLYTVNLSEIYPFTPFAFNPPDGCIFIPSAGNLQIPDIFQLLLIFVFIFSTCHFYILLY